ncbi:ATP-binding protein [Desulfobacterales bacterium HSG2]|nr:ATP-binding protein [Desulfobacterales bacterium HSG2]
MSEKQSIQTLPEVITKRNKSVNLSVILEYDTLDALDEKNETAEDDRTVWLCPETQFVRIAQPYNIGTPATKWFYGRQDILESMADNLHTGTEHDISTIVYGMKRAGKTSLIRRFIKDTIKQRGYNKTHLPVYTDLLKDYRTKKIENNGDFLFLLLDIIAQALNEHGQKSDFSREILSFREEFSQNPFETFSMLLEEVIEAIKPRKLLLVLDEFSTLHDCFSRNILTEEMFGFLSNTIQSTYQLSFIFTGTYVLLEMMREHAFDLAKICNPLMVSFLDDISARKLVVEPVKRDDTNPRRGWLEYNDQVVDRIVAVTNCHPYLIQYLCMQLVDKMNLQKHNTANLNNINEVVDEVVSKPSHSMPMLALWNEFDEPEHQVLAAIAAKINLARNRESLCENDGGTSVAEIASIFKEFGRNKRLEEVVIICSKLVDAEILERSTSEETEFYRITIPLYQMWLKRNKSLTAVFSK